MKSLSPRFALRLRPVDQGDARRMRAWMDDPQVSRNLGLQTRPTLAKTRAWIAQASESPSVSALAIEAAGRHVGNLVFDRLDRYLSTARLSIYIGEPAARLRGLGTRALRLGLQHAFTKLRMRKVWLVVHCQNTPAIRAYLNVGFTIEGVLREEFILGRRRLPVFYMGILRREFRKTRGVVRGVCSA